MERFYHIRAQRSGIGQVLNNGGATVHLESIAGDPLHIRMRVAYCNPVDVFCKKLGRQYCTGRAAFETERTRRNKDTGEIYNEIVAVPALQPKDTKVIPIRRLPTELGAVWKNVHRRMKEDLIHGEYRNFDGSLREWLPRE